MSNHTTLIGNLGADPELKYTPNGKAVVTLRVADTPRNLDRSSGQWVNGETDWVTVVAWENLAENVAASLKKGDKVVVMGSYRAEKFTDKEKVERVTRKLVATEISPSLTYAKVTVEKQQASSNDGGNRNSAPAPAYDDDAPF